MNKNTKHERQQFANRLKELRLNRNLSQEKLAEIANLHRNYVGSVERGERNISIDNIEKLANALNIAVGDFHISHDKINTIEAQSNRKHWMFKTVSNEDRSYISHDGYDDILASKYVYDSNVANSKQVSLGDFIVLVDKTNILGYAKISRIKKSQSTKEILRCPIENCGNTTIDERKTISPKYRCNKGHEFDTPVKDTKPITKFEAYYGKSFHESKELTPFSNLKPYFVKGYNRNMSIQRLDKQYFEKIDNSIFKSLNLAIQYIDPMDTNTINDDIGEYTLSDLDSREGTLRLIKVRRGQPKFRNDLLKKYNETCCVTGCTIKHLLEAAHIKPYRGKNDNHTSNGLLLRADIHTLFDLDLIGIHPETLVVYLNEETNIDGYNLFEGKIITGNPSKKALQYKWSLFIKNK